MHTEVQWLSQGKVFICVFALRSELVTPSNVHQVCLILCGYKDWAIWLMFLVK